VTRRLLGRLDERGRLVATGHNAPMLAHAASRLRVVFFSARRPAG